MNDLFGRDPLITELLDRIEALEAVVYQQQKSERVKASEPLNEAWQLWNTHRSGKKGWTPKARELSMKKLCALAGSDGELARKIVEQSIESGWTGLFPIKSSDRPSGHLSQHGSNGQPVRHKTLQEALAPTESREANNAAHAAHMRRLGVG